MTDAEKRVVNAERAAVEKRVAELEAKLHKQTAAFTAIKKGLLTFPEELQKPGTVPGDFFLLATRELPNGIQA